MDIKQIQDLIKFVAKSGVNEVAIEEQDFKITIKTNREATTYAGTNLPAPAPAVAANPAPVVAAPATDKPAAEDTSKYMTIKSPMIGTFYRSSSPDKPSIVNVGDSVCTEPVIRIIGVM